METVLDDLPLVVRKIQRSVPSNVTADQPTVWTPEFFDVADTEAEALAAQLSEALDAPGWYVDLHTAQDSFIVFPGRRALPTGRLAGACRGPGLRPRPRHSRLTTRLANL
ncbi:conserved hypothetical protein [Parafrankia sp. EAN1pec]|uniref:hypothetical protein n=1 Tax=Parafrankia sp. (strain EAN1pec) TaxID=298653 RepID=UPI000054288C|nr:conserved hypothetical protein [Frankia sp. EAN1pec]